MLNLNNDNNNTNIKVPKNLEHYVKIKSQIIATEEGEETQTKDRKNIFHKVIVGNFSNLKMEVPIKTHEATEHQIDCTTLQHLNAELITFNVIIASYTIISDILLFYPCLK